MLPLCTQGGLGTQTTGRHTYKENKYFPPHIHFSLFLDPQELFQRNETGGWRDGSMAKRTLAAFTAHQESVLSTYMTASQYP